MKLSTVGITVILLGLGDAALACRPMIFDPLDHIASGRSPEFTTVFVGEIVGMRKPKQIIRLSEWWSDSMDEFADEGMRLIPIVVGGGLDLQLEVFPTDMPLRGEPDLPHTVTLLGCTIPSPAPELGASGVAYVTESGWGKFERRVDDLGFGVDPAYMEQVRRCLNGDCNRGK